MNSIEGLACDEGTMMFSDVLDTVAPIGDSIKRGTIRCKTSLDESLIRSMCVVRQTLNSVDGASCSKVSISG